MIWLLPAAIAAGQKLAEWSAAGKNPYKDVNQILPGDAPNLARSQGPSAVEAQNNPYQELPAIENDSDSYSPMMNEARARAMKRFLSNTGGPRG